MYVSFTECQMKRFCGFHDLNSTVSGKLGMYGNKLVSKTTQIFPLYIVCVCPKSNTHESNLRAKWNDNCITCLENKFDFQPIFIKHLRKHNILSTKVRAF